VARRVCEGALQPEILHRSKIQSLTARVGLASGTTIVVKMWKRRSLLKSIRRRFGPTPGQREWASLCRLSEQGVPVPCPLLYCRLAPNPNGYVEAVLMEDLGPVQNAWNYMMDVLARNQIRELERIEEAVISHTAAMVKLNVPDLDNTLANYVVRPSGEILRIDLEATRRVRLLLLHPAFHAASLGHLVVSYALAVAYASTPSKDVVRIRYFAQQLAKRVHAPRYILRVARALAVRMMKIKEGDMLLLRGVYS
jgi:hypothetical protein